MQTNIDISEQFERHLNSPKQTWLLAAGASFPANIPLMYPLTSHVLSLVRARFAADPESLSVIDYIVDDCGKNSHIEHHLTYLGDNISIAGRSRTESIMVAGLKISKDKLLLIHEEIIKQIATTVRWGFKPEIKDDAGAIIEKCEIGSEGKSIVNISGHLRFIKAVFGSNRSGLDFVRTPVEFFTLNYDTLVEDALAINGVEFQDGFIGGGVGFWNIKNYAAHSGTKAIVSKLHGSIDWYRPSSGTNNLLRIRYGDTYPEGGGSVMIYPQATKYINTQRDPFAEIFQRFRHRISQGSDHVLLICGYSFGDEHVNAEIEIAMSSFKNQLTVVAFSSEPNNQLPATLEAWRSKPWSDRLFIASPNGLYQGSAGPVFPHPTGKRDWWTFEGVAKLLADGLPKDIQEAMA